MHVAERVTPQFTYGRKLVRSAMQGARAGEEVFLHGRPLHSFLDESAWHALKPAALAACVGALGGLCAARHRSTGRALAWGVLGATLGFGFSLAWESRALTTSIASAAWRKITSARDEHWLERHPIDYA